MQSIQRNRRGYRRLKTVFCEAIVSCDFAVDNNYGEMSRPLGELLNGRYRDPATIDVTERPFA